MCVAKHDPEASSAVSGEEWSRLGILNVGNIAQPTRVTMGAPV